MTKLGSMADLWSAPEDVYKDRPVVAKDWPWTTVERPPGGWKIAREDGHSAPNLGVISPDERPTDGRHDQKDES